MDEQSPQWGTNSAEQLPGLLRDRYEILKILGKGTFAVTYLARDRDRKQRCVVKALSLKHVDTWKARELFEREARILANLQHPGIPKFVDYFQEDTPDGVQVFLVQEYIEGKNLFELVNSGKHFTEAEALRIAEGVAEILVYLGSFSPPIIHRDIKPTNVLLGRDGRVYLIDFGAVRDKILHEPLLQPGGPTIVGTYGYMPMEQFEGRAVPASDIYSLGATLLFLISHKEPWEMEKDAMRLDFRPHVQVSSGFEKILRRMIDPDWKRRYSSASELKAEMSALLTPPRGVAAGIRRWKIPIGIASALIAISLLIWIVRSNTDPPQIVDSTPREISSYLEPSLPGVSGRLGDMRLHHGDTIKAARFSPDGKFAVTGGDDRALACWEVSTGRLLWRSPHVDPITSIRYSPDGRFVAVAGQNRVVVVYQAESGSPLQRIFTMRPPGNHPVPFDFTEDSRYIAVPVQERYITFWNLNTGQLAFRTVLPADSRVIFYSIQSKELLALAESSLLFRIDLSTGKTIGEGRLEVSPSVAAVSSDRRFLVVGDWSKVEVWDTTTLNRVAAFPHSESNPGVLAISKDGKTIAMDSGEAIALYDVPSGKATDRLQQGHFLQLQSLDFSADGTMLISAGNDSTVRFWKLSDRSLLHQSTNHEAPVRSVAFSHDGARVISAGLDSTVRIWNAATQEQIHHHRFGQPVFLAREIAPAKLFSGFANHWVVCDANSGKELFKSLLNETARSYAISRDGRRVAILQQSIIQIADTHSGKLIATFPDSKDVEVLALSRDGSFLATVSGSKSLQLWDSTSGKLLSGAANVEDRNISHLFFSNDGKYLITGGFFATVYEISLSRELVRRGAVRGGRSAVLSPDQETLAAIDLEDPSKIKVYTLEKQNAAFVDFKHVAKLAGHSGPVKTLEFGPGGSTLASAGNDTIILLWDISAIKSGAWNSSAEKTSSVAIDLKFDGSIESPGLIRTEFDPEYADFSYASGKSGKALALRNELLFPETEDVHVASYTVQFWFKLQENVFTRQHLNLFHSNLASLDFRDGKHLLLFLYYGGLGGHRSIDVTEKLGEALKPDNWYHFAMSYDRTNQALRVYINGDVVHSDHKEQREDLSTSLGVIRLWAPPFDTPAGGALDEFRLVSEVRRDYQIAADAGNKNPRDLTLRFIPRNVNDFIRARQHTELTTYRFTDLLNDTGLFGADWSGEHLWFATSKGLLRFNPLDKNWLLFGANSRIPGTIVNNLLVTEKGILATLASPTGPHTAVSSGIYLFDPAAESWSPVLKGSAWNLRKLASGIWIATDHGAYLMDPVSGKLSLYDKNKVALLDETVMDVAQAGNKIYFAMPGNYVRRTKDFTGGGITEYDLSNGKSRSWTDRTGLARGYSYRIIASENDLWAAHFGEEYGLSHYDSKTDKWRIIKTSREGIPLGGVSLYVDGQTLWIGQQDGLIRYDPATGKAIRYTESSGLPGYIVYGITGDREHIWLTAYRISDVTTGGIVAIPR